MTRCPKAGGGLYSYRVWLFDDSRHLPSAGGFAVCRRVFCRSGISAGWRGFCRSGVSAGRGFSSAGGGFPSAGTGVAVWRCEPCRRPVWDMPLAGTGFSVGRYGACRLPVRGFAPGLARGAPANAVASRKTPFTPGPARTSSLLRNPYVRRVGHRGVVLGFLPEHRHEGETSMWRSGRE